MRTARPLVVLAALVAGSGCFRSALLAPGVGVGGDAGIVEGAVSRRLVAWQVEAAGAPPLVMGIYDTQEKVHCRFLHDQAGQLRCLPSAVASLEPGGWFSDPACQKPVYQTDALQGQVVVGRPVALPPPLPSADCAPPRYAVGILGVVPPSAPRYGGSPCAPLDFDPGPSSGSVNLGVEEVEAPDRWATGTEIDAADTAVAGRLRLRQIETSDGARFDDHLVDGRWSAACALRPDADGVGCWPDTVSDTPTGFEDTQCQGTPVWTKSACGTPVFIGQNTRPFHAFGDVWRGAVFAGVKGCMQLAGEMPADGPAVFFEQGAALDADAVVAPAWQTAGAERFQLRGLQGDSGAVVALADALWVNAEVARFRDTGVNEDCNPVWTPEGRVRCVPTSVMVDAYSGGFFADDACQRPAYFCLGGSPCAGRAAITLAADANGERRPTAVNVAEAAPTTSFLFQGACAPAGVDPLGFFALGAARSWDQYPLLTERNGRPSGAP